ncbi:MAG: TVP38/TMEM64 family protein [Rhodospirillales bacterium]|nr:TVP38/TMEM64 family protein [Rhodospirillales bacterium]MBT4006952.1 TVP38/TMEM64 family protein [Rhodospirillales bacterium]MBT5075326.1 TVP38/TMEM64 family protein [Rhodospirillales bacterium]MBT5113021.1 TVP38/TMEM64 family protein [Rhodospirillales bacterium]MBT5672897.1 TVP38/TMEM64 family protein [Rhodospirillales bacterium]
MAESEDPVRTKPTFSLGRLVPLGVMAAALIAFFALDLNQYLNFGALKDHQETLSGFVASNAILAAVLFIVIYAVSTAISLPGGAILTIAGGFLFGTLIGTVYVVIGASLGATGLFLAARTALGEPLRARAGPQLQRMEKGFRENAFSYLLFLRLIPIFPFWLVNLVPAFLGVPIGTYFIGTLIGIIPGSFVFASVGNGLGALFAAGKTPDLGIIFAPDILIPIAGLGLLALVPVLYKRFKDKKKSDHSGLGG